MHIGLLEVFGMCRRMTTRKIMKAGVSLEAEQPTKKQKKDKKQKEINSSEDEDVDVEKKKKQKEVGECKGKGCQRGERQG